MNKERHKSHTWSPFGTNQVCVSCWCIEHEDKAFQPCHPVKKGEAKKGKVRHV